MEAANYPNVFAPTNVDVDSSAIGQIGPLYAALFDATLAKASGKAIVTEYAWNASGCGSPCNGTALEGEEVQKLGADVLFSDAPPLSDFVLTRVHARYDGSTLTDDIVFRTADAVSGGNEFDPGAESDKPVRPVDDASLGFQVRYAVRHPWSGPIECPSPKRGGWILAQSSQTALGFASGPRDVELGTMVKSPIAALGLAKDQPPFGKLAKDEPLDHSGEKPKKDSDVLAKESSTSLWIAGAIGLGLVVVLGIVVARSGSGAKR
jgi:hypothetical protein